MEQQQSRVSFSVGTKLLISVVSLLIIVIIFLNFSTVVLLIDDKRAYTYQSQTTEAVLAGKEFTSLAGNSIDTLRLALGAIDPTKPVQEAQKNRLQGIVDNQSDILMMELGTVLPASGQFTSVLRASNGNLLSQKELNLDEMTIPAALIAEILPNLTQEGFGLMNLSSLGGHPLLGVVVADRAGQKMNGSSTLPIAVAYVSLHGFGRDIKASDLAILTKSGGVLFSTDPETYFTKKSLADDPLFQAAKGKLASGTREFEADGNRFLGSYTRPGLDTVVVTKTPWRRAMRAAYALVERFILLGTMAIGAAIIFAILFSKTLTAPLQRLYEATRAVAAGDFNIDLQSTSSDEIGSLTDSFVSMSRQINELILDKVDKVHLENELAIASTVQQTLFPPERFQDSRIQIFSHYQSASECGGDWWGFFEVGGRLCMMIADATGHGLPSALITASARSCFSVMHKIAQEEPEFSFSPAAMLSYANRVIYDTASGKIMMTFFTGVIDFDKRTFTYASAGHNPPWLFKKKDGAYSLKSLVAVGQRLGEAGDVPAYEEKTVELDPDDILFLYTDGVMEGKSAAGEMYGKKRVRKIIEANLNGGPEVVIQELLKEFMEHNKGKPLDDDVTLAAARILDFNGIQSVSIGEETLEEPEEVIT